MNITTGGMNGERVVIPHRDYVLLHTKTTHAVNKGEHHSAIKVKAFFKKHKKSYPLRVNCEIH